MVAGPDANRPPSQRPDPWQAEGAPGRRTVLTIVAIGGALVLGIVVGSMGAGDQTSTARTMVPEADPATSSAVPAPPSNPAPAPTVTVTVTVRPPVRPPVDDDPGSPEELIEMPKLVGMDLQVAQDTAQASGLYILTSHDATGAGRLQVLDRNWKVCSQSPAAGRKVAPETQLDFGAVKQDERCP